MSRGRTQHLRSLIWLLLAGVIAALFFPADALATADFSNFGVPIQVADATGASAPWTPGVGSAYPSTVHVFGLTGVVTHLSVVVVGLEHQRIDDLNMLLVSPDGRGIQLLSDAGGDSQVGDSDSGVMVTFDDAAAGTVPDSGPLQGFHTYKPSNYFGGQGEDANFATTGNSGDLYPSPAPPAASWASNTTLAEAFNGTDPNGDWKLYVTDDRPGDIGGIDPTGAYVALEVTAGGSPTSPIAPNASVKVSKPSTGKATTVFDASASLAGGAAATSFKWDLGNDGKSDAECPGSDPLLITKFDKSGSVNVGLTVSGAGGSSSTQITTSVNGISQSRSGKSASSGPLSSAATKRQAFICAAQSAQPEGPDLTGGGGPPAGCNETVSFDIVEAWGCFTMADSVDQIPDREQAVLRNVVSKFHPSSGARATAASTSLTIGQLVSTQQRPIAISNEPVRLNGLDFTPAPGAAIVLVAPITRSLLKRESLPSFIVSSNATVGWNGVTIARGRIRIPLGTTDKSKSKLVHLGDFRLPSRSLLGELPLRGRVGVDLAYHQTRVGVAVELPTIFRSSDGGGVTGSAVLTLDNPNGLLLDSLEIRVPHAAIGGFGVDDLDFRYQRENSTWEASGAVFFPPGASIAANVLIQHGALQYLYVKATPPDPGIQSAPGVFINYLDFTYDGRDGNGVGGGIGVSALGKISVPWGQGQCSLVRVDGHFMLKFADPVSYRADGDVYLLCVHLVHGYYEANSDGHFGIGGDAVFRIGDDIEFSAKLDAAFDADAASGHMQIDADLNACVTLWIGGGCFGAEVAVSDVGVGICADLGFTHAGGGVVFPNNIKLFADSCDIGPFRPLGRTARSSADTTGTSFSWGAGKPSGLVAVTGVAGPPSFTLKGPHGRTIHATGSQKAKDFVVAPRAADSTTYLFVRAPAAGTWTVVPDAGTMVTQVRAADGMPAPKVSASISGHGSSRTLSYRVNRVRGQKVSFTLKGAGNAQAIGVAHGSRGKIHFRLSPIADGRQNVVARVTGNGVPRESVTVAHFTAQAVRLAAPRRLRLRRRGSTVRVSWSKVAGAQRYLVVAKLSNGTHSNLVTTRTSTRLSDLNPSAHGRLRVYALPRLGRRGAGAAVTLRAIRPPRVRP